MIIQFLSATISAPIHFTLKRTNHFIVFKAPTNVFQTRFAFRPQIVFVIANFGFLIQLCAPLLVTKLLSAVFLQPFVHFPASNPHMPEASHLDQRFPTAAFSPITKTGLNCVSL